MQITFDGIARNAIIETARGVVIIGEPRADVVRLRAMERSAGPGDVSMIDGRQAWIPTAGAVGRNLGEAWASAGLGVQWQALEHLRRAIQSGLRLA